VPALEACDVIAQRTRQPIEHARIEEKRLDVRRLPPHTLVQKIVEDEAVAAGKLRHKCAWVGASYE
jgi:hypothetical protein